MLWSCIVIHIVLTRSDPDIIFCDQSGRIRGLFKIGKIGLLKVLKSNGILIKIYGKFLNNVCEESLFQKNTSYFWRIFLFTFYFWSNLIFEFPYWHHWLSILSYSKIFTCIKLNIIVEIVAASFQSLFNQNQINMIFRTSHGNLFYKKGILEYFAKLTGKHLCWSLFLNKVTSWRLVLESRCRVFLVLGS